MAFAATTALITGASSGLGEEFARQLARRGANLVLVARSEGRLIELAAELQKDSDIQVHVLAADLANADEVAKVTQHLEQQGIEIDLLVNNAGVGIFKDFIDTPLSEVLAQIDLNVKALVSLTHTCLSQMRENNKGGVINIASSAAFQPLPGANVYAASKAFVLLFSEALSYELRATGITVTAACPGPVATRFFDAMRPTLSAAQMDQPTTVVREILEAYEQGKRVVYPGKRSVRLGTWGARMLPRNLMLTMAAKTVGKLNQK